MTGSPTADADRQLAEAAAEPLSGWDFSRLAGRVLSDPLPWDYVALAGEAAGRADRPRHRHRRRRCSPRSVCPGGSVAVEPYPPNLPVARARLLPYGIDVRARTDRRLPCDSSDFDLVLNRHGALDPVEIARVLRPGGVFWTQQVGAVALHLRAVSWQVPDFDVVRHRVRLLEIDRIIRTEGAFVVTDHRLLLHAVRPA